MLLTTLGYEGLDVQTFFGILQENNVQTLVDIRELPISRKRGFSKSTLMQNTVSAGLRYVHIPDLGAPRNVRHEYRDDEDWVRFSDRYLAHLKLQTAAIDDLVKLVSSETCCLLCFEADHLHCHRRYVASAVYAKLDGDINIKHLALTKKAPAAWLQPLAGITLQQ